MADLPPSSAPDGNDPDLVGDASNAPAPVRRPLPRAARLSRLTPPTAPPPGAPAAVGSPPDTSPAPAPQPLGSEPPPSVEPQSIAALAAQLDAEATMPTLPSVARPPAVPPVGAGPGVLSPVTSAQRPAEANSRPNETTSRPTVKLVELVAAEGSGPSPAVAAAQHAAAAAATKASDPVVFKPINETMATRSVILSGIGIVLCFFPVLSLAGLLMGLIAQRRIQRSNGALVGRGSARWGILLGTVGLVVGATADMVFLLRR